MSSRRKRPPTDVQVTPAVWAISKELPFPVIDKYWDKSLVKLLREETHAYRIAAALFVASREINLPTARMLSLFSSAWVQYLGDEAESHEELAMTIEKIGDCLFDILTRPDAWQDGNEFQNDGVVEFGQFLQVWEQFYSHNIEDFRRQHEIWMSM